jgi:hypothetical protein
MVLNALLALNRGFGLRWITKKSKNDKYRSLWGSIDDGSGKNK